MSIVRSTGSLVPAAVATETSASTTVTTGVTNAVQTLGSTTGIGVNDGLYFATANVVRYVLTVDSSTQVTLTASATTTTSEVVTRAIANTDTMTGIQVDVLADNTSIGEMALYAVVTSTATTGTIDLRVNSIRVSGQVYQKVNFERQIVPINGTQKIPLGRYPASRYMAVDVKNNATGARATVTILYELFKVT